MPDLKIINNIIDKNHPAYIIAELSANHNQNFDLAVKTIRAMKEAGADAVKLQTFTPASMTLNSDKPWFQTREDSLWAGQKLYDLFKKAFTPWEWHPKLQALANELGLDFFSSPFDIEAVEKLESINVPAYKVASLEITDIPLIERIAQTGKPVIISTGIAREEDIQLAIDTCLNTGNDKIALLKCTSAYPTPFEEVNLSTLTLLQERFKTIVGLSDHTLGMAVPVAAVALGARIIEKHFILDKSIPSLDRDFSLDPDQFRQMVMAIRETEKALGKPTLELTDKQKSARNSARSLFAVRDIQKGEVLSKENIKSIRPGLGLHPRYHTEVIGKKANQFIEKGTPLSFDLIVTHRYKD